MPRRASVEAILTSQETARSQPAPEATPLTFATTGTLSARTREHSTSTRSRSAPASAPPGALDAGDVEAGAERPLRPGQDHDPHLRVGLDPAELGEELVDQLRSEGVALPGAVEGQPHDGPVALDDQLVRHRRSISSSVRPASPRISRVCSPTAGAGRNGRSARSESLTGIPDEADAVRVDDHLPRGDLGVGQRLRNGVDRGGRDSRLDEPLDGLGRRKGVEALCDSRDHAVALSEAAGGGPELGVLPELRQVEGLAELLPHVVRHRHQHDVAVAGGEELRRHDVGMGRARVPLRLVAAVQVVRGDVRQHREVGVEQRDVHVPAHSGRLDGAQGGQYGEGGEQPGGVVDDRHAELRGHATGLAGQAHRACEGLDQVVVGREVAARTASSVARDRARDDARVDLLQRLEVDPEPLGHSRTEVVHDDVRGLGEAEERPVAPVVLEVERDASLVAVQRVEVRALAADAATGHAPREVWPLGRLDLDDVRAEVAQEQRAVGAGQHVREVEHPEAGEREQPRHVTGKRVCAGRPRACPTASRRRALWPARRPAGSAPRRRRSISQPGIP